MDDPGDALQLTEILTTAAAVADYLGAGDVTADHMLKGLAILRGELALEDLGRPISPLVRRPPPLHGGSVPEVRVLAQRWYTTLGADVHATLTPTQLAALESELRALLTGADPPRALPSI